MAADGTAFEPHVIASIAGAGGDDDAIRELALDEARMLAEGARRVHLAPTAFHNSYRSRGFHEPDVTQPRAIRDPYAALDAGARTGRPSRPLMGT